MARAKLTFLLFLVSISCLAAGLSHDESYARRRYRKREFEEYGRSPRSREGDSSSEEKVQLNLGTPKQVLETDGGSMWVWRQEVEAIRNMAVGIAGLQLQPHGLLLPNYADSPNLAFVLKGCGYMGAVFPGVGGDVVQPYVRQVKKGDVVALPKGTVHWWYNDGEDVHDILFAADTSLGVQRGYYSQFILAGGESRHFGSLLHGFRRGTLATAWGVDREDMALLLESQSEVSIIRVDRPIRFPKPQQEEESIERERERYRRYREGGYDNINNIHAHHDALAFRELKYTSPRNQPDFFRENGGFINVVNCQKLPALLTIGFSVAEVTLEKNAMFAPSFISNAHELIYITQGNGRMEVSGGDGKKVFDEEVHEGMFVVVPQYLPSVKIAGNEGLEWVSIFTSERPSVSFLAGTNSVYCGIPQQVLANAFNVEEETLEKLGRQESVIFPKRRSGSSSQHDETQEESVILSQRSGSSSDAHPEASTQEPHSEASTQEQVHHRPSETKDDEKKLHAFLEVLI